MPWQHHESKFFFRPLLNFFSLFWPEKTAKQMADADCGTMGRIKAGSAARRAADLHPRLIAYAAFFAAVFGCMAAAAIVVGTGMPVLLVGL